jgi:hypothetical protein
MAAELHQLLNEFNATYKKRTKKGSNVLNL